MGYWIEKFQIIASVAGAIVGLAGFFLLAVYITEVVSIKINLREGDIFEAVSAHWRQKTMPKAESFWIAAVATIAMFLAM